MSILKVALSQYGVKEITGRNHNKTIVDYAKESGFEWVNDDETPWCSIFINWVAFKACLERTKSAVARSWLKVGVPVLSPETGDVVVFKRGNSTWQGHVGIYISEAENSQINVLGGNQSNAVKISSYDKKDLLGYRRLRPLQDV
jgi:uncharacterized protein (TIGR02594 family)